MSEIYVTASATQILYDSLGDCHSKNSACFSRKWQEADHFVLWGFIMLLVSLLKKYFYAPVVICKKDSGKLTLLSISASIWKQFYRGVILMYDL